MAMDNKGIDKFIGPPKTKFLRCQLSFRPEIFIKNYDPREPIPKEIPKEIRYEIAKRIAENLVKSDLIEYRQTLGFSGREIVIDASLKVVSPYNELKMVL